MRPLRYTINVTVDGCCDHMAGIPSEELHRYAAAGIERSDAMLFGRVTYQMMETAWRLPITSWTIPEWMEPFARTMDAAKKYVVSRTLKQVDWNTELLHGDLAEAVQRLKQEPGKGIAVAGTQLALALTELGLIDEYEFIIHPRIAGHGPTLFAGLTKYVDLQLVDHQDIGAGLVVMKYAVKR